MMSIYGWLKVSGFRGAKAFWWDLNPKRYHWDSEFSFVALVLNEWVVVLFVAIDDCCSFLMTATSTLLTMDASIKLGNFTSCEALMVELLGFKLLTSRHVTSQIHSPSTLPFTSFVTRSTTISKVFFQFDIHTESGPLMTFSNSIVHNDVSKDSPSES